MAQRTATPQRPASRRAERARARRRAARRRRLGWTLGIATVLVGAIALVVASGGGDDEAPTGPAGRPFVGGDLHSLATDPNSERVYVGGHEAVAVSTNGGRSWQQVASLENADAMGWAFTDDAVLVGGHPGLHVSEDGGRTFEQRNGGLPSTDLHAIGAGPDGGVIYAASPQVGVFASTDGGRTWETRTDEVGRAFMGRILVDPEDPDHVVAPDMQAGAVESTDGGRTWEALGGVEGVMWVSWDPAKTDHLVVSGMGGAAESTDGGRTWQTVDVPAGVSIVEISASTPTTLFAAAHGDDRVVVSVSEDGGRTWLTNSE